MADYTYQEPDSEDFIAALRAVLKNKGEADLLSLLHGATCTISPSSQYSRRRWDAMWTEVFFEVPAERLGDFNESTETNLEKYCDLIMPKDAGFDVMSVSVAPRLGSQGTRMEDEVEALSRVLESQENHIQLPEDLFLKGQEMAQAYHFLYLAENFLRVFIETIASSKDEAGNPRQLTYPRDVHSKIRNRKQNEQRNKWLSVRGGSDLFYTDFKELGDIILNNWEVFASFFPNQAWIKTKIDEMANCRNLIAHNSYIGEHERDVVRLNFQGIIRQLGSFI